MILIPKAFVTIENTLAINPTEESLIKYFSEEGLDSIEAILEFYDNDWNEILRRWFVGSYYSNELIKQNFEKGIFRFDTENNEENIEIINEDEFDNFKKWVNLLSKSLLCKMYNRIKPLIYLSKIIK